MSSSRRLLRWSEGAKISCTRRGHNSICMYDVEKNGTLTLVANCPSFGNHDGPRHVVPSPDGSKLYAVTEHSTSSPHHLFTCEKALSLIFLPLSILHRRVLDPPILPPAPPTPLHHPSWSVLSMLHPPASLNLPSHSPFLPPPQPRSPNENPTAATRSAFRKTVATSSSRREA